MPIPIFFFFALSIKNDWEMWYASLEGFIRTDFAAIEGMNGTNVLSDVFSFQIPLFLLPRQKENLKLHQVSLWALFCAPL